MSALSQPGFRAGHEMLKLKGDVFSVSIDGNRGGDWASGVEAARLEMERGEESMERLRLRAIVFNLRV